MTSTKDRSSATPAQAIGVVLGVVAFAAGVTKKWILTPIGTAFGDLEPEEKVIVTAILVVGIIGLVAFAQIQRRSAVRATRKMIDRDVGAASGPT